MSAVAQASRVIAARGLGRRFGQHWAVRDIDLDLASGQMLGVVGADGSGKTTLMQMLAAILDPSAGECRVFGLESRRQSKAIAQRIGYMTQGFTLYDTLTAEENLRLAARLRGLDASTYRDRRAALLSMAGLERFFDRPAGKLSGGMRKKLSLCTILIHEPDLLILDEPGLGVDPLSRRQLWDMLQAFRARGASLVVATSYMDEAERCDRLLLLRDGTALATDTPQRVRARADGRVFEITGGDPVATAATLRHRPELRAVQVLANRVRFMTGAVDSPIEAVGGVSAHPAVARLEDVFALDLRRESDDQPNEEAMPPVPVRAGIRSERLCVQFGALRAVDAVSLTVAPGELLALLGPNGAGKTTLIRALCGLIPISGGSAEVAGVVAGPGSALLRQRIGYMSQRFSLYPDLSVGENLAFFSSAYGLATTAALQACAWACTIMELDPQHDSLVAGLSGAQRQRLALACSVLHRPSVLFLDEPTSGIDPLARYRFWWLIRRLAAAGTAILVTTHYLDEANYCDRIGLMDHGRLIGSGTLDELRRATASAADADVETVFVRAIAQVPTREQVA
ncbi:ATP-binding cassette domain-containing protein [Tahibacter amnicola]|uniref:ATP-binding cassette domain-containing protein n=1 Tax=Tahibacter amnicola TaxID=2976241 RepID=A0ABY6B7H4_9GAMM|nr:ATP-binding cassette domain-containing protein [Tahibacter amnicola]UXI66053.1 ATP-binding cassette domain-containing protein [Tahibacter amnicola]